MYEKPFITFRKSCKNKYDSYTELDNDWLRTGWLHSKTSLQKSSSFELFEHVPTLLDDKVFES